MVSYPSRAWYSSKIRSTFPRLGILLLENLEHFTKVGYTAPQKFGALSLGWVCCSSKIRSTFPRSGMLLLKNLEHFSQVGYVATQKCGALFPSWVCCYSKMWSTFPRLGMLFLENLEHFSQVEYGLYAFFWGRFNNFLTQLTQILLQNYALHF